MAFGQRKAVKRYADKNGFVLPSYTWNVINCTNAANNKWVVTANQNSWKKQSVMVGLMRNQVLPVWNGILGNKPLPSGIALDEMFKMLIETLGDIKEPRTGKCTVLPRPRLFIRAC